MGFRRLSIDDASRGPSVHDVVDNVMGAIERENYAAGMHQASEDPAPPAARAPIVLMPRAQATLRPGQQIAPIPPLLSHGNYIGSNWTSGHYMRPGELMRPDDFRVLPVDSFDEAGYWHDFGYNQGWRNMHRSLNEGYSNADALLNFHYRAMEVDRGFAQDATNAEANTWLGEKMRKYGPKVSSSADPGRWAQDRQRMIDRIQNDGAYRNQLDLLPREQLFQQSMPNATANELSRLEREDRWRDQMRVFGEPFTEPLGVP